MILEITMVEEISVTERLGSLYIFVVSLQQSSPITQEEPTNNDAESAENRGPPVLQISVNDEFNTQEAFGP